MSHPRVIARDNVFVVHAAKAMTGEVPLWDHERGVLWWADVQGQRLLGLSPETGAKQVHHLPSMLGLIALNHDGRLLLGLEDGLYPFDPGCGLMERSVPVEEGNYRTRINDGKPDNAGRLWFGTMERLGSGEPIGSLYRLDPDGSLHMIRTRIAVPNSISFAPDGKAFYFADSRARTVEAFEYDPKSGELGPSRVFVRFKEGEIPDGSCTDCEGALWIAVLGGARLERRLPDGTLDTIVELPVSRPTMPTLGGQDGRTLFITSQRRFLTAPQLSREPLAGDLLATRVDVPGPTTCTVAISNGPVQTGRSRR